MTTNKAQYQHGQGGNSGGHKGNIDEDENAQVDLSSSQALHDQEGVPEPSSDQAQEVKESSSSLETTEGGAADDDNTSGRSTSSNSPEDSPEGGEGYTADCSSDASSELSASAKKNSGNVLLSVDKLSLNDKNGGSDAAQDQHTNGNDAKASSGHRAKKKKHGHRGHSKHHSTSSQDGTSQSDESDLPVQWNGVKVVHPMDPRIDISRVGYQHEASVGTGVSSSDTNGGGVRSNVSQNQEEIPSYDHYVELMEVVRPFFNSHGICAPAPPPARSTKPLDTTVQHPSQQPIGPHPKQQQEVLPSETQHQAQAADSRTSTSFTGSHSSSSQSSEDDIRHRVKKDAPLHIPPQERTQLLSNGNGANPSPEVPLELAARQKPLQAAAAADFYAPDDPDENDNSDSSSMVVCARSKRKHKQTTSNGPNASETSSQQNHSSDGKTEARKMQEPSSATVKYPTADNSNDVEMKDIEGNGKVQSKENSTKHHHKPLSEVAQAVGEKNNNDDSNDSNEQDQEEQAQGNASSSSDQQVAPGNHAQHQPLHAYDAPRVVTESGSSNNNNTTSGNSGSNQGSSGSGNGSSGSGNEGKNSSEDVEGKEAIGADGNSNSEDINSDDRKPEDEKEIAHPVAAKRQSTATSKAAVAAVEDGGHHGTQHSMKPPKQAVSHQGYSNIDHYPENEAARERKLLDKKRKRMNMRREYEEKVQKEMESSESSAPYDTIALRPGKPVTIDKVLSFTKIARIVIQAGPPFLVVHTNAAYTRLTGIDAHAAVGKPVAALLATQSKSENMSSSTINADLEGPHGTANRISASSNDAHNSNAHSRPGMDGSNGHSIANSQARVVQNQTDPRRPEWGMNSAGATQNYGQAAAAGVARAAQATQNSSFSTNVNLEPLVAACGFGKYQILHATSRPHHMVGRNVTFVNKTGSSGAAVPSLPSGSSPDMGNNFGSNDCPYETIACRASISPIISNSFDYGLVTDNNQDPYGHKTKRRKHQHGSSDRQGGGHNHRRPYTARGESSLPRRYQQFVTHYAIQLERFDDEKELNQDSLSSSSRISVEANMLGLTKAELRRQREVSQRGPDATSQEESEERLQHEEEDELASETTEATVPVTAVG